jgi:hypothetical protein
MCKKDAVMNRAQVSSCDKLTTITNYYCMKLPLVFSLAFSITMLPTITLAESGLVSIQNTGTTTTLKADDPLTLCKNAAFLKRNKTIQSALKEYVTASQNITEQAKNAFQKISWYVSSSYKTETKKIQEEKKSAMKPVTIKVNSNRKAAILTYEAEAALCDKIYGTISTSTKATATSTKKR